MDEERPRGPPNCGTGFFCITDAVEKGDSQKKCVKSAPDSCEARGLLFCEANGDCVEPNDEGLRVCERGSEAARPRETTRKPREESRPTRPERIVEQERAEHEMREKPSDPREAAMTRSEMYVANATQVR